MHEDTENNMFKDLLADYAAPADDNGFSDHVLNNLDSGPDHNKLKTMLVGGAGLIGAAIAGLQLPGLWNYLTGIKVPSAPSISAPAVDSSLLSTSYGMMAAGLIVMLVLWIANNILFGEDM